LEAAGAQQLGFFGQQASGLQQGLHRFETARWYVNVFGEQGR
jgi:hypothetical protein